MVPPSSFRRITVAAPPDQSQLRRKLLPRTNDLHKLSSSRRAFATSPNAALKDRSGTNMMRVKRATHHENTAEEIPMLQRAFPVRHPPIAPGERIGARGRSTRARCFVPLSTIPCGYCDRWASSLPPAVLFPRLHTRNESRRTSGDKMNGNRSMEFGSRAQNTAWALAPPLPSRSPIPPTTRNRAIIHGILGWLYVIYFALFRS